MEGSCGEVAEKYLKKDLVFMLKENSEQINGLTKMKTQDIKQKF